MQSSATHSQPMTLATNYSKPSEMIEPDHLRPVPPAENCSRLNRSPGHQVSHGTLNQQAVADPALHSRQCSSPDLSMSQPVTWVHDGSLEPASLGNTFEDLFDTSETLGVHSEKLVSMLGKLVLILIFADLFIHLFLNSEIIVIMAALCIQGVVSGFHKQLTPFSVLWFYDPSLLVW